MLAMPVAGILLLACGTSALDGPEEDVDPQDLDDAVITVGQQATGACPSTKLTFETRHLVTTPAWVSDPSVKPDAASLASFFQTLPEHDPGYGASSALQDLAAFDNHDTLDGTTTAIASHVKVSFTVDTASDVAFRIGVDYGLGGALLIDGEVVDARWQDMWWNGDWGNTGAVLIADRSLRPGAHVVEAYGYENCCDGAMAMQFRNAGGDWTTIATDSLSSGIHVCGTVTDDQGQPVPRVTVTLRERFRPFSVSRVVTGADGRYLIPAPAAGQYSLGAAATLYRITQDPPPDRGARNPLSINLEQDTIIDWRATWQGRRQPYDVSGQVTDQQTGQGIAGLPVCIWDRNTQACMESDTTDATGHYRVHVTQPGAAVYYLRVADEERDQPYFYLPSFQPIGYWFLAFSPSLASQVPDQARSDVDFVRVHVAEATTGFMHPLPYQDLLNYGFFYAESAFYPGLTGTVRHPGVDVNSSASTAQSPLFAAADGVVIDVRDRNVCGGFCWGGVIIKHFYRGHAYYTEYGHADIDASIVRGKPLAKGDTIAHQASHNTSSPHLHFEIRNGAHHPAPHDVGFFYTPTNLAAMRSTPIATGIESLDNVLAWYEQPESFVKSMRDQAEAPWIVVDDAQVKPSGTNLLRQWFGLSGTAQEDKSANLEFSGHAWHGRATPTRGTAGATGTWTFDAAPDSFELFAYVPPGNSQKSSGAAYRLDGSTLATIAQNTSAGWISLGQTQLGAGAHTLSIDTLGTASTTGDTWIDAIKAVPQGAAPNDFDIIATTPSVTVGPRQAATFTFDSSVVGASQTVDLGVTGLPADAQATFVGVESTANGCFDHAKAHEAIRSGCSFTLHIRNLPACPTATGCSFPLTVTGSGATTRTAAVTLIVLPRRPR
jgi:murein DD-endopeptidase MepM/ murein hydrolase activator NlpD